MLHNRSHTTACARSCAMAAPLYHVVVRLKPHAKPQREAHAKPQRREANEELRIGKSERGMRLTRREAHAKAQSREEKEDRTNGGGVPAAEGAVW